MISHLDRYRQIAEILSRNGLGFLVSAMGLEGRLPFRRQQPPNEGRQRRTRPEYLRTALEELGPTYVKIGQLLSTRPDLLPPEYQEELAKLQDDAVPVPWPRIHEELRQELDADPLEVFASFNTSVMASASIGQVYAASLRDGTQVVVKVRRPGIAEEVAQDLEILQNLANTASKHWEAARDYDVTGLMEEFASTLRGELDYLQEGRNADRFQLNFENNAAITIPVIYWDYTTSRVLTMERISGTKVTDTAALDAAGIDRPALARAATACEMQMVFDDGFFHADPHPGNLFVEPGGSVGLIDFGMVGEVDERLRNQLSGLFVGIVRQDPERMANALVRINASGVRVDRVKLRMDLGPLIRMYSGKDLHTAPVGNIITTGLGILRTHHIQLPREMALLLRMLIMTEGMGEVLDPDFRLGPVLGPYARRMARQQLNPVNYARRLGRAGTEVLELGAELPDQVRRLLNTLDFEGMEVHIRAEELLPLVIRLERVGNRMVAAIFASAFIRGVGELALGDSSRWKSWQAPLMSAGLASTGALGGYIAWTSRRTRLRGL
ncbi:MULTISPECIES: ABC1 kinase family protein [unclassified Arthrobacter]|uniref:ABC1 kinase family protein n=1 Tax=unclassified Arthrobacter TaxID=235627 RepID=UPI001D1459B7|nr:MULTISPECIES: AarF/ABC1/UbiB kinase family protein [unclassified Arthrobacter]MCC3274656.1 AarF/ABC1/UbiB kinase family protein [Arthrobacter sp. zg-Y20]MCC9177754.1 AarF/ABC1/UbiB kinase family protein [Arthrobacter sp. zg-Y750]MDK1314812.1 AarF/ABC1/UbiB kinase family protein [Arthrobacter sp. zg.Y20]MDK1327675.1 AarF/ABC1/UbiB kinase family protein [Arthrobacter sp. zg-Y1143]WIB04676.1 AarF/ABC1/UbiB kinase family protein [Arthrobacter sp. zg-Y20]